jgi:hypothetical protein
MRFHREYGSGGEEVVKWAGRVNGLACVTGNAGSVPRHPQQAVNRQARVAGAALPEQSPHLRTARETSGGS